MAIRLKTAEQLEALGEANRLVAESFRILDATIRPGTRLSDLDDLVWFVCKTVAMPPLFVLSAFDSA